MAQKTEPNPKPLHKQNLLPVPNAALDNENSQYSTIINFTLCFYKETPKFFHKIKTPSQTGTKLSECQQQDGHLGVVSLGHASAPQRGSRGPMQEKPYSMITSPVPEHTLVLCTLFYWFYNLQAPFPDLLLETLLCLHYRALNHTDMLLGLSYSRRGSATLMSQLENHRGKKKTSTGEKNKFCTTEQRKRK